MKTLMVILLLKLNFSKMEKEEKEEKEKKDDLLTCMASPQVKMYYSINVRPKTRVHTTLPLNNDSMPLSREGINFP